MEILQTLIQLRDDIKTWVTNNLVALDAKIESKTVPIDSKLSTTSANPVQNKAIAEEINSINSEIASINSNILDLEDAANDSIIDDGSGDFNIADPSGNVIFKVDADGIHTIALSLNGKYAATVDYVDNAIANIDIPDVDFTGYATEDYVSQAVETAKIDIGESLESDDEDFAITDNDGNIIFRIDATGAHTTELTLNGESAATESYVDDAIANIEFPTTDLTNYATKEYVDNAIDGIEIPDVDFTGYATETYVDNKVADLVNSAPEALNTLGELAMALENHEDAYDALLETVGSKATHTDLENLKNELSESIVSEASEFHIVDEEGNIVASIDAGGVATTTVTAQAVVINGENVIDALSEATNQVVVALAEAQKYTDNAIANIEVSEWAKTDYNGDIPEAIGALPNTTVIPSTLSDLTDDASHRTVTDLEKEDWNKKSNFSGNFADLTGAPSITEDETGELNIADQAGNIAFRVDNAGTTHVSSLTIGGHAVDGSNIESVAYSDLKLLRDNSQLLPGKYYRITDYVCTTTQENTRAASHKFDIIVLALSKNTLSETAYADYHYDNGIPEGYFHAQASGSLLEDSVTAYYYIVDDEQSEAREYAGESDNEDKFVAYEYLADPKGNILPVLYKTSKTEEDQIVFIDYRERFFYDGTFEWEGAIYDSWIKIETTGETRYFWGSQESKHVLTNRIVDNNTIIPSVISSAVSARRFADLPAWELKYCLDNDTSRFAWADAANGKGVIYYMKDEWNNQCAYDFVNITYKGDSITGYANYSLDATAYYPTFIHYGNSVRDDAAIYNNNLSKSGIKYEELRYSLPFIVFLGQNCNNNTFGNYFHSNTFGSDCSGNTFGDRCLRNTFGNYCYYNTFGDCCISNVFGDYCHYNAFGDWCYGNTFGDYCYYNTFGNDCSYNIFGSSETTTIDCVEYIRFESGCQYIKLLNSETADSSNWVQDVIVSAGVRGTLLAYRELQVSRNAAPVVYEAANTTHIILD